MRLDLLRIGFAREIARHPAADGGTFAAQTDHRLQHRRTISVEKECFCRRVSRFPPQFEPAGDHVRHHALERQEWIVRAYQLPVLAYLLGPIRNRSHEWVLIGKHLEAKTVWVTVPHEIGTGFSHRGADCWPHQAAVKTLIDFRKPGDGGKGEVVIGAVAAKCADIVERASLETEQIISPDQLGIFDILVDTCNYRLVKTRRHQIDHVHSKRELAMLLGRDLPRDKDAEMANTLMQAIDDRLTCRNDLVLVIVKIEDPVQCLLWRRDVVTPGAEYDNRGVDIAQVDANTV